MPKTSQEQRIRARNVRLLLGARAARSVGQGLLAVDFALYLKLLRWSPTQIGILFMGGLLLSSLTALFLGPLSDRFGRRRFLIGYELTQLVAAMIGLFSARPPAIVAATLIGGFGHGLNGGAGPFAPIELAWLSHSVSERRRPRIYSLNMAIGFAGMGVGALLAATPYFLRRFVSPPEAFRLLFLFVIVGSGVCLALLARAQDSAPGTAPAAAPESAHLTQRENRFLARLMAINALNGAGIGLIGPLMAYWFAIRFGKGPHEIAPVMAAGLFLTAISSLLMTRLSQRVGVLKSVIGMRLGGAILLFLMPLAPSFTIASGLYIIRSAMNRGTAGARQAINIGIVRSHRRGFAASLNNASLQIPRAIGPVFAGMLFSAGSLGAPFMLGAGLQLLYIYFYQRMFRGYDKRTPSDE